MAEGSIKQRWLAFPRWQRWFFILSLLLLFYTVFGFFILPAIVRSQLETKLTEALHRQTTVAEVKVNPFTLQCEVNGFEIRDKEKEQVFVGFDSLQVNVQGSSLFKLAVIVQSISLINPSANVALHDDLSWNFSDLLLSSKDKKEEVEEEKELLPFSLNNIEITGGKFHFDDQIKGMIHEITDLHLAIPYVSDLPSDIEIFIQPAFEAVVNGTAIGMKGGSKPFHASHHSEFNINFTDIDLTKYINYLPDDLGIAVHSGLLDLTLAFNFTQHEDGTTVINTQGTVGLRDVDIRDRKDQPILSFPEMTLDIDRAHILRKEFQFARFYLREPLLTMERMKNGEINLLTLLPASVEEEKTAPPTVNSLLFNLKKAVIDEATIHFSDQVPGQPALFSVDKFNLAAANISNEQGEKSRVDLDFHLNETATVKVGGSVGLTPLNVTLDLGVKGLPFKAAQPYLDGKVKAIIGSGTGELTGSLSLVHKDDNFALNFHGNAGSHKFSLLDTKAKKVLSWESFLIEKLDVTTVPMRVFVETVVVDGMESFVSINEDGLLNLANLADKAGATAEEVQEDKSGRLEQEVAPKIEISQVKLSNSRLDFQDHQVSPPFTTSLQDIQGRIKGLSSSKDVFADLDISAKLGRHSPITISGKIHPWEDFFADLMVGLHDVELSPMSPYSLKFISFPLTKGKLNLDLHYLVDGKKLTSENKAFIDQITLGDFVKNDTATSLPVSLAISLLKNRAGEIALDIPVSGELDDPEFSVAGVIFTVIKNLLIKAATSPFALLGPLFPDNRDFLFVEFEPGDTKVIGRDDEKWAIFAKAMYDHPALKLDVIGFVEPEQDSAAMTRINFDRQLKVQKLNDLDKQKQAVTDVDDVVINPEEYEKYLKKAYKAATFERPKNMVGLLKGLPPAEMEKLIYDHIVISDDDLHQLGMDRATIIKDYLVETGPVEPERIFLLQPKNSQPDGDVPAFRVEIVAK